MLSKNLGERVEKYDKQVIKIFLIILDYVLLFKNGVESRK
jgi:hypothetical protein